MSSANLVMEPSEILGCNEERSGNSGDESGWTAYICSPIRENRQYSRDIIEDEEDDCFLKWENYKMGNYSNYNYDDTGSDDSMNSDASSGPTRVEFLCKSNKRNEIMSPFKYSRTQYSSRKIIKKQIKQIEVVRPRITFAKQIQPKSAASHVSKKRCL